MQLIVKYIRYTAVLSRVTSIVCFVLVLPLSIHAQCIDNIRELAAKAKAEGRKSISVPTPRPSWAVVFSLQEAAKHEAILLVTIQDKQAKISPDGTCINTWYRASVIANLGRKELPPVNPELERVVPPELSGLTDNDILIRISGGTLEVDGVKAVAVETPVRFAVDKQYLIFASFQFTDDGQTQVRSAALNLGKTAVFSYEPATDEVTPLDPSSKNDSAFASDVLTRSDGRLARLKSLLSSK